jgi:rhomboid protease GluP
VEAAAHRSQRAADHPGSWLDYPATYLLVAINVAVFAWMFRYGPVPALLHAHRWGTCLVAQFSPATLMYFGGSASFLLTAGPHGEWWRLITAMFVHVTVLHLLINMWCLWNLGIFGEPLLGKPGLIAVYVLTGAAGNLLSFAWAVFTRTDGIVAGASGAVFGIAGILIVLLSNRRLEKPDLPWAEIRGLRFQVILFAVANLAFGIAPNFFPLLSPGMQQTLRFGSDLPHVANTAHIGGFLAGLLLGLPLFPRMTAGKRAYRRRQRITFAAAALCLSLFGYAVAASAAPEQPSVILKSPPVIPHPKPDPPVRRLH